MMRRIFEPFHGGLAYSQRALWMAAGSHPRQRWEPPVSRQGNKAGFVVNAFRAWGLNRAGWSEVHVNDMCPVAHLFALLLASSELRDAVSRRVSAMVPCSRCLPDIVACALEQGLRPTPESCKAAMEMSGQSGCDDCKGTGVADARALWERIRKTPVRWPTTFEEVADLTAQALFMQSRSFQLKPVTIEGGAWDEGGFKAEFYEQKPGAVGNPQGFDSPRWTVAERVAALPGMWVESGFQTETSVTSPSGAVHVPLSRWETSGRVALLPGPAGVRIGISRMDALEWVRLQTFTPGDVLILDPHYLGDITVDKPTSGYAHTSSRDAVLEMADRGHRAGALVLLHEGVGLAKDLGRGWDARSASPLRARGSTFHAGGVEREWVTFNRKPVWWPAEQAGLFSGGALRG